MTRTKSTVQFEHIFDVGTQSYNVFVEVEFSVDSWLERHEPFYHEPMSDISWDFDFQATPEPSQSVKRLLRAEIEEYISQNLEELIGKAR